MEAEAAAEVCVVARRLVASVSTRVWEAPPNAAGRACTEPFQSALLEDR